MNNGLKAKRHVVLCDCCGDSESFDCDEYNYSGAIGHFHLNGWRSVRFGVPIAALGLEVQIGFRFKSVCAGCVEKLSNFACVKRG